MGEVAFPLANQIFTCTTILEDGSVYISSTCGSSYQPDANITITRATKTNEEIVIDNAVKFIGYEDQIRYDTDYEKNNPVGRDETIDANYRRIFKNDGNGNYYFYAIERLDR